VTSIYVLLTFLKEKFLDFVITKHRWMVVIPVILPLSLLYNFYSHLRFKYTFYMKSSPKHHAQKVDRVRKQVRANNGVKV
jgi:hypothetical protein